MKWNKLIRMSPDFLIVGAQKSGTTYLFNLLLQHTDILPPKKKEVHFFDNNYNKGENWYLKNFPIKYGRNNKITFEASPYYLYHPLAPKRIFNFNKDLKIIILLRNPVNRAISHLEMIKKRLDIDIENILNDNFENEIIIQKNLKKQIINNPNKTNEIHQHYSFLSRGIYVNQIKKYLNYFDLEKKILIIKSENLFIDPKTQLNSIFKFLNLNKSNIEVNYKTNTFTGSYNREKYTKYIKSFQDFYKPFNKELETLLQQNFNWF